MPVRITITPDLAELGRILDANITNAIIEGTNDYLGRLSDALVVAARRNAPPKMGKSTGEVRESIVANVLRSAKENCHIVIDAKSRHAQFTEEWPTPHWVNIERHPDVKSWVESHDVKVSGGRYLWVYGPKADSMRRREHWFLDSTTKAANKFGGPELIQSIEEELIRKLPYDKIKRAQAARLGHITREARKMTGLNLSGLSLGY